MIPTISHIRKMDETERKELDIPLMTSLLRDEAKSNGHGRNNTIGGKEPKDTECDDASLEPPDGGWGWLVCLGSTLCFMLVGVQGPCFGIFYVDRLQQLGSSPTLAAWLFNFQAFCYNLAGPLATPLAQKFSYRLVALVTGMAASSSFLISAFVTDPSLLLFTFSFICGVGGGICINCCFQMNARYFTHRLGLANGMMMAGGSLGLMLIPHMASYLQELYPFEWANIIAGTALMNAIPAALLFQPVEWHMKKSDPPSKDIDDDTQSVETNNSFQSVVPVEKPDIKPLWNNPRLPFALDGSSRSVHRGISVPHILSNSRMPFAPKNNSRSVPRGVSVPHNLLDQQNLQHNSLGLHHSIKRMRTMSESPFQNVRRNDSSKGLAEAETPRSSSRLAIFYLGGSTIMGSVLTLQQFPGEEVRSSKTDLNDPKTQGILKNFASSYQLSILQNPLVVSVALFTSLTIPTAINMFSVMPFVLSDAGYSLQSSATAMTVTATVDLVTRLLCAPIIDQPWVSPRLMYGAAQLIFITVPFAFIYGWHHWWAVLLCMAVLGLGLGIIYILDVFLIVLLLGKEKLEVVYGMSQLFRAVAFLCLGPVGGTLRVATGSYASVFLFYVGTIILAFLILLFTVFYTSRHPKPSV